MITIALSKGRIFKPALLLLQQAGITIADEELNSRKLILNSNFKEIKIIVMRPTDVPVFVEHGAADIGITGKDSLLEYDANNIFELLDLKIAKCKLMVAGKSIENLNKQTIKVATKYVNCAKNYFNKSNKNFEIIKLYGAVELAPIVNMSDVIVDLVASGNTLKANNLMPLQHIYDISSRLIVNNASWSYKNNDLKKIIEQINNHI